MLDGLGVGPGTSFEISGAGSDEFLAANLQECASRLSEFNMRAANVQTNAASLLQKRDRMSAEQVKQSAQQIVAEIDQIVELGNSVLNECGGVLPKGALERVQNELGALGGYRGTLQGAINNSQNNAIMDTLGNIANSIGNVVNWIGNALRNLPPLPMPSFPEPVL